jgi:hypothetical protein
MARFAQDRVGEEKGLVKIKDGAGYFLYENKHFEWCKDKFNYEVMTIDGYRAVKVLKTRIQFLTDEDLNHKSYDAKVTFYK